MLDVFVFLVMMVVHICSLMVPGYSEGGAGTKTLIRLGVMATAFLVGYGILTAFVAVSGHGIG